MSAAGRRDRARSWTPMCAARTARRRSRDTKARRRPTSNRNATRPQKCMEPSRASASLTSQPIGGHSDDLLGRGREPSESARRDTRGFPFDRGRASTRPTRSGRGTHRCPETLRSARWRGGRARTVVRRRRTLSACRRSCRPSASSQRAATAAPATRRRDERPHAAATARPHVARDFPVWKPFEHARWNMT